MVEAMDIGAQLPVKEAWPGWPRGGTTYEAPVGPSQKKYTESLSLFPFQSWGLEVTESTLVLIAGRR